MSTSSDSAFFRSQKRFSNAQYCRLNISRAWLFIVGAIFAIGFAAPEHVVAAPNSTPVSIAPEFPKDAEWLNTLSPLTLEGLRGRFVILDFWTFCCINCMHALPELKRLEDRYPNELVVVGVHSAKFTNEKDSAQITEAIARYGIQHPVINDKNFAIWKSYQVRAWPTLILIDPEGKILARHSGESPEAEFEPILKHSIPLYEKSNRLKRGERPALPKLPTRLPSELAYPGKIVADGATGRLFIADTNNNRILVSDRSGAIATVVGSGEVGSRDGALAEAQFHQPQGLALSGSHLYVADTGNHTIRDVDFEGKSVSTIFGTGVQASPHDVARVGRSRALNSPWDLVVIEDSLYVAMAGAHQIWRADLKKGTIEPFAGTGEEARVDGPRLSAAFAQPSGITTDGAKLYVADSETSSIRSIDLLSDGAVKTIVGKDLFDFGDIDGDRAVARLQHPIGLVATPGALFVADTYNSKIKRIDLKSESTTTISGTVRGYSDGEKSKTQFNEPSGIAVIGETLFVADTNNDRIRTVDLKNGSSKSVVLSFPQTGEVAPVYKPLKIELPPVALRPGDASILLTIQYPAGFKPNPDGPSYVSISSEPAEVVQSTSAEESIDLTKISSHGTIPLRVGSGSGVTKLSGSLYFCTVKEGSCYIEDFEVTIPVSTASLGISAFPVAIPLRNPLLGD